MVLAWWIDILHSRNRYSFHVRYLEKFSHLHKTLNAACAHTANLSCLPFLHHHSSLLLMHQPRAQFLSFFSSFRFLYFLLWSSASSEDLEERGSDFGTLMGLLWLVVFRLCAEPGVKLGSSVRGNLSTAHWFQAVFPAICSLDGRPSFQVLLKPSWLCHRKNRHLKTQGPRHRWGTEAPKGQRIFVKIWMYRAFKNKTKQPLSTLLTQENVENLAEGGNEFRISLVLPASDLHW